MEEYKYHYFYKITNLINNKYYYGVHSTNNLNDGYMGSGKRITAAIKKYGIENFSKEILKFFDSRLEMFEYEHLIVNEEILKDPQCYNLVIGGIGYSHTESLFNGVPILTDNGKTWKNISKEEYYKNKEKYITTTKNKITVKDKLGKIYCVDKTDERYLSGDLVPIWNGKRHREESKEKIRNTMTPKDSKNPRVWVSKDGKFKYLRKELLEEYLNNGWIRGRIKK